MGGVRAPERVIVVIPFREGGKSRLPLALRRTASLAMLSDVLAAAAGAGTTIVVTGDPDATRLASDAGARVVADPGGGQGAAVAAALRAADGPCLVVNADLPCVTSGEIETLAAIARDGRFGIVAAGDGTTNALALPSAPSFAALYGAGSADRFRAHAAALGFSVEEVALPGLEDDVDTADDLERLDERLGAATRAQLVAAT